MSGAVWPPRPADDYYWLYPPSWADFALCAEVDPEIFFPEKGGSTLWAKRVCTSCPVTALCLDYALKHGERYGIWGGKSERERRAMRRRAAA